MSLAAIVSLFATAILVGLLYSLFTIGLSLSFRVLNYPDITLEGSVILGGALSFNALHAGLDPFSAILVGALGGAVAGLFTAIQYLYFGVSKLLSGIITTAILYSINIRLLGGRANVRFENIRTIFDVINPSHNRNIDILVLGLVVFLIVIACTALFRTRGGILLKALGDNEAFIVSLGQNPKVVTLTGLALSNAVIGLGGAVLVQYKNTCDVNMSFGLLISALAAMVLGETILQARKMWLYLIGSIVGTVIYNLAIAVVLFSWSSQWERIVMASDVRLVTGLLLIVPTLITVKWGRKFRLFKSDW
jgi:putative ABC transport system permease protein